MADVAKNHLDVSKMGSIEYSREKHLVEALSGLSSKIIYANVKPGQLTTSMSRASLESGIRDSEHIIMRIMEVLQQYRGMAGRMYYDRDAHMRCYLCLMEEVKFLSELDKRLSAIMDPNLESKIAQLDEKSK